MKIYDIIIIGGGAAGLFCSATFPCPVDGLILEKTKRPGTKLLMSGSGHCNITHGGNIKDFPNHYGKNGKKIRGCLYKHSNQEMIAFLEENNIQTNLRDDGKVFPQSMEAREVLNMLLEKTKKNGFKLHCEASLLSITFHDGVYLVKTKGEDFSCKNLIIATGGCSYKTTGSDGSMFKLLEEDLDLEISELKAALTPINVKNYPYREISGVSFKKAHISIWRDGKKIAENLDDVLMTHTNFSGPGILNISKEATKNDQIMLNYLYPCNLTDALDRINKVMKGNKMNLVNSLAKEFQLPKNFLQILVNESGEKLKTLAARLTSDTFTVSDVSGFDRAMVTAGGVSLEDVNLASMECKKWPGLFFTGEVLDIDGETGGYNLQFAYSSARIAGDNVLKGLGGKNDY